MRTIALFLILGSLNLFGQSPEPEAQYDEIIWFGLDYTLVKFIGVSDAFSDLEEIRSTFFRKWNELILAESSKYDLKSAFHVGNVIYDFESAITRSEARNMGDILQTVPYSLSENQVVDLVKAYSNPSIDGVGAIFVMETLNKLAVQETIWVTLFHVSTGEVIKTRRLTGAPKGFGLRNYWAGGYYQVITQCIWGSYF